LALARIKTRFTLLLPDNATGKQPTVDCRERETVTGRRQRFSTKIFRRDFQNAASKVIGVSSRPNTILKRYAVPERTVFDFLAFATLRVAFSI
jgi:hypothetical protein